MHRQRKRRERSWRGGRGQHLLSIPQARGQAPSRCNVSPFCINRKDDSRNLSNKIRRHKNGSYFTLMREMRDDFLHTEKPGML